MGRAPSTPCAPPGPLPVVAHRLAPSMAPPTRCWWSAPVAADCRGTSYSGFLVHPIRSRLLESCSATQFCHLQGGPPPHLSLPVPDRECAPLPTTSPTSFGSPNPTP